jgi:hypothetical protein
VRADLTLVARLTPGGLGDDVRWLVVDGPPFASVDAVDFFGGEEISEVYRLYESVYGRFDSRLNVRMPAALAEYNRWVLLLDEEGAVHGFACFKTTAWGLKLGLLATDGSGDAKAALVPFLRRALNVKGVYAEVSEPLESSLVDHVPVTPSSVVGQVLGKLVTEHADGRHYTRVVTNVGLKAKLMVGLPSESPE